MKKLSRKEMLMNLNDDLMIGIYPVTVIRCDDIRLGDLEILNIHCKRINELMDEYKKIPLEEKKLRYAKSLMLSLPFITFFIIYLLSSNDVFLSLTLSVSILIPAMTWCVSYICKKIEDLYWLRNGTPRCIEHSMKIVESYLRGKRPSIGGKPETNVIDDELKLLLSDKNNRNIINDILSRATSFLDEKCRED